MPDAAPSNSADSGTLPDEQEWIERALSGEEAAMEWLYRCYEKSVYTLAYRLTGQSADAQDVLQDSFIRCFDCLHQYQGNDAFWPWLKRITITTALMRLRRQRRWQFVSHEPESDYQTGPEQSCENDIELTRALASLTPTGRAVLWLYHGEGYSHAEIAALWGKSVSFSKSQLARALQRLRSLLNDTDAPTTGSASSGIAREALL
ncbi:MAG: RNA polymerase sigma factor SigE [Wenzhouxiangellaceae bacterium]